MTRLPKTKLYEGQALLLVLLAMSVVLTVALSIVSRSVTDISNSGNEESSARAFAAAEAGVEKALIAGTGSGSIGNANFTSTVSSTGLALTDFNYPIELSSGDTATVWYVAHDVNGNLVCNAGTPCYTGNSMKFCWGAPGTSASLTTTPALEVSVYFATTPGNYSTTQVAKIGIDPNNTRGNGFIAPGAGTCTVAGKTYQFQTTIYFSNGVIILPGFNILNIGNAYASQNGLLFAKVRLLYNTNLAHNLGVSLVGIPLFNGGAVPNLPAQGINITSSGTSGNANRKLQVFQGFAEPPSIFDSVVYSNGGLVK